MFIVNFGRNNIIRNGKMQVQKCRFGEERAGTFAELVFLMPRDGWAAVPHGATGLSAVCDYGIS